MILVLLLLFFSIASPSFVTLANLHNLADQAAILMVVCIGATFVILLGSVDLSVEGVMALSGVAMVLLVKNDHNAMSLGYLGVLAAVLLGSLIGLLNGVGNALLRIPSFMVTLGTWSICLGLATSLYGGNPPRLLDPAMAEWGIGRWLDFTRLSYLAAVCVVFALFIERYTRFGRYVRVIGGAEDLARLSGINLTRYKLLTFTVGGTLSGLAGVMAVSQLGVAYTTISVGDLFAAITAVVVGGTLLSGGRGGILQSLVGVLIVTVLANGMIHMGVSPYVQEAIQGVVIVAAVGVTNWHSIRRIRVVK